MKIFTLLTSAVCCLALPFIVNANQTDHELKVSTDLNQQSAMQDPRWFCDHFPESCYEVCKIGGSPWGPYKICRLRPPWDPIPASDNPFDFVGQDHNDALEKIGSMATLSGLDKRLTTTHMIQLTAEYLCMRGITGDDQGQVRAIEQTADECEYRYAGIATKVFDELRNVIYLDDKVEAIASGYLNVLKSQPGVSQEQLAAIENLFALFPSDDNIEELPYLFDRIDEYNYSVERKMSPEDAELVLLGSSVMRASLEYWLNQLEGPSDWLAIEEDGMEPVAKRRGIFKKILWLVFADSVGCLGGAGILGIPGCVIGGVGASAGAGANW